jgi:short-chain Z-isoprenyl diphosphate synthase
MSALRLTPSTDGRGEDPVLSRPLYRLYERRLLHSLDPAKLPRHVGVILDGHRRFARSEGLADYTDSYRTGMLRLEDLLLWCQQLGIPAVTAWVLSTENLHRPQEELQPLLDVLNELLERLPVQAKKLGFAVRVIGSRDLLPTSLLMAVKKAEEVAADGQWRVTVALGYGGRQEIVDACRSLVADLAANGTPPERLADAIDAEALARHLYTAELPDPDLVIRTSGASRLSGFLLWQAAYAEYVFIDTFWPAFRRVDFLRALRDSSRRERRFGR